MNKEETKKEVARYTISQAIPQMSLNSREKFVCLRVFTNAEKHTLEDWGKLIRQKKIK